MSQHWFVKTSTGKAGPFSASQLRKLATSGKISSTSNVSPDGSKWVPASRIKGLEFPTPTADPTKQGEESVVEEKEGQVKEIVLREKKGIGGRTEHESSTPVSGMIGAMTGAVMGFAYFAVLWLFWVINIWPFAFGLGGFSGGDPSNSVLGKIASSISASALSIFAGYGLLAFLVLGTLAGVAGVSGNRKGAEKTDVNKKLEADEARGENTGIGKK